MEILSQKQSYLKNCVLVANKRAVATRVNLYEEMMMVMVMVMVMVMGMGMGMGIAIARESKAGQP